MMKEIRYGGIKVAIRKIQLLLAGPAHDMLMHVKLLFLPTDDIQVTGRLWCTCAVQNYSI